VKTEITWVKRRDWCLYAGLESVQRAQYSPKKKKKKKKKKNKPRYSLENTAVRGFGEMLES
jgi:hypothetical protein